MFVPSRRTERERERENQSVLAHQARRRPPTYVEHCQHHVVVVDEKDELLLAIGKLCRHSQDKVLHLSLQGKQALVHLGRGGAGIITANPSCVRTH